MDSTELALCRKELQELSDAEHVAEHERHVHEAAQLVAALRAVICTALVCDASQPHASKRAREEMYLAMWEAERAIEAVGEVHLVWLE